MENSGAELGSVGVPVVKASSVEVVTDRKSKVAPPPLVPFAHPASPPAPPKKVVFIYNPISGGRKGEKFANTVVLPAFEAAGIAVDVQPTQHAGHAEELAQACDLRGVDAIVAMGGDGTLSDVFSGYRARSDGASVTLGFLPAGTGNTVMTDVLGHKIRGAKSVAEAVQVIVTGHTRKVDASRIEYCDAAGKPVVRHSINIVTAGLGVDANAAAEKRRWMGPMRYDVSIVLELLKLKKRPPCPCKLVVDGAASEMDLFVLTIMNNKRSGVGLRLSPKAQLDDGKIDVMYTPVKIKSVLTALKLDGMIKKKGIHVNDARVKYETCSKTLTLEGPAPIRLMNDGEVVGYTPLKLDVLPAAFTLYTPLEPAGQ